MPASAFALLRRCIALWQPITRALENLQAPAALRGAQPGQGLRLEGGRLNHG